MHARGIVHRDLKLANVFVKEDGHIVIGDLGLALDLKSPDKDDTRCCGTTPYMAPEMFDGRVQDAKVDMWALGVCFYMLLTGNLPFCGQDHWDTVRKIREEPVTFPPAYDDHQPETRMLARDVRPRLLDACMFRVYPYDRVLAPVERPEEKA
ncbi:hypothetical protein DXG03_005599 [Asterophora parasitica]|uniref:Protein kinase domain-containing protein n=1 Tax=Asterophora parasitica TaxID=117018 RepID=A0A9P7FN58_9AGAR|nr:hypothetical protein DXG03_005599 [Asterophora parasitica]